jgi:stage II sporulation protein D
MTHNGQFIEAVYFASSGGVTENSENVWREARPYLRSVSDRNEFQPVIWQRTFTLNEISHLLTQNRQGHIGTATSVRIASTLPSGRVERLVIEGTGGQLNLEREEIRTFFARHAQGSLQSRNFVIASDAPNTPNAPNVSNTPNVPNTSDVPNVPDVPPQAPPPIVQSEYISVFDGYNIHTVQRDNLYVIDAQGNILPPPLHEQLYEPQLYEPQFREQQPYDQQLYEQQYYAPHSIMSHIVLEGRGFGHGVGMSQRGAEGMARLGYNHRQILQHFYTGITIH